MSVPLFPGYTLAVLWDSDDTLTPGYMQTPIFNAYGIDEGEFWKDVTLAQKRYAELGVETNIDSVYLLTFLSWVHYGRFPGLSIGKLTELGAEIKFHKGMPLAMKRLQQEIENDPVYRELGIKVEHYIISQGLRQMLIGTDLVKYATRIYGCDFIENLLPPSGMDAKKPNHEITVVGNAFTSTDKTRAVFEISKGTAVDPSIGVNDAIAEADRRIPLNRMVYVGDGPTDIPVWSILRKNGGKTLAVYNPTSAAHRARAMGLEAQDRVDHVSPADYRQGQDAYEWIALQLRGMADKIVEEVQTERAKRIQKPGGHINPSPGKPKAVAARRVVAPTRKVTVRPKAVQHDRPKTSRRPRGAPRDSAVGL